MVQYCCAYNCTAASDLYSQLMFHSFPNEHSDKERRLKWISALKRKNFTPGKNTKLCSSHFVASDYKPPVICGKPKLKSDAVPSIFDFPAHLQPKQARERRPLVRVQTSTVSEQENVNETTEFVEEPLRVTVAVQTNLTGIQLDKTLNGLRRDKKCLQQRLNRRNKRVTNTLRGLVSQCPQCNCEFETVPVYMQ